MSTTQPPVSVVLGWIAGISVTLQQEPTGYTSVLLNDQNEGVVAIPALALSAMIMLLQSAYYQAVHGSQPNEITPQP